MELRHFAAEIDDLRALIAVEERDAEAEEEIFRSFRSCGMPSGILNVMSLFSFTICKELKDSCTFAHVHFSP